MKHSVPHDLPIELAKKAADHALNAYRARFPEYEPQVSWTGNNTAEVSFRALGQTLRGSFEILHNAVTMDMEVPLMLRPFKSKAMEVIEREIVAWINKAKEGGLS